MLIRAYEPPLSWAAMVGVGALVAAGLASFAAPGAFLASMAAAAGLCVALSVLAAPSAATVLWLFAVGTMPDMWLGDLWSDGPTIIAAMKLSGLAVLGCCILRWCVRPFNPGFAFLAMFGLGLAHGLHPSLPLSESIRSLLGSAAPFAFSFANLPRRWSRAVARSVQLIPLFALLLGVVLGALGVRPLFTGQTGLRLAGPGHPAFLAGFATVGIWASLLALLLSGQRRDILLLGLNFAILGLTGARGPLAIAGVVTVLALVFAPAPAFPARRRLVLLASAGLGLVALIAVSEEMDGIRLLGILRGDEAGLSGRDLIWPIFREARDLSPWVGWGVGAGKVLVPEDDPLARLLGTTAAHNEYLRIGVDGGWLGLALLVALFFGWTWWHTRRLSPTERVVLRLVMAGFAVHAYTDNVLIATTASVLFTWVSAAFAGGARSARPRPAEPVLESA
jgi:O-antigen ligase